MKKQRPTEHASKDPYTLFDITGDMKRIIVEITEAQQDKNLELVNELTDELIDMMEIHSDKYAGYAHTIKNSINAAEGNQAIANEFQAIATAHNNLARRLKDRLQQDMEHHGITKVNAGIFSIRTQINSVASLEVSTDAEELPERFQRIEINNEELRFALSSGEEVDGAELVKGSHVRITAKR